MKVHVFKDAEEVGRYAAQIVLEIVKASPELVLGLATGGTQVGFYDHLVSLINMEKVDLSRTKTFNLDEYYPMDQEHPQSFHSFMVEHFFQHVAIREFNRYIPDGMAPDIQEECRRYEQDIVSCGGINLQILGIGENGHIGFNEPGTSFSSTTHGVELSPSTIQANARFFEETDKVPRQAITMGIKTIMNSQSILLLAFGKKKAEAIRAALHDPVSEAVPASILQLHPNVTVLLDEAAAAFLHTEDVYITT